MHALDIRTLVISYALCVLVCVWASAITWRQNRQRFPATTYWLLSFSLQFLALVLVLLRDVVPDLFSIIGNSLAAICASICMRIGIEHFFDQPSSKRMDGLLVTVFIGIQLYFTYVNHSLYARNINYAFFLAVFFVQSALVALRVTQGGMLAGARLLAILMLAHAMLNVMRIIGSFVVKTGDVFFLPNAFDAAAFLVYQMLIVALTFSLSILINQRLRMELEADLLRIRDSEALSRESEAKLKRAEAMGKTGHWALHLGTREIMASEEAARIYGLPSVRLDYESIRNARTDAHRTALDQAMVELITMDKPYDIEFQIRALDSGEIKDVHSVATFDKDANTVFGTLRDITQQKAAERTLHDKESLFRAAVETSSDGFWIVDMQGRILDVNAAYAELSGYTREELLTLRISELDAVEDIVQTHQRIAMVAAQGHATFETAHRRKDGSVWPVEIVTSYASNQGGCCFVFVRDITEKKNLEALTWHHANYDLLTDLPNRALLHDRLAEAISLAKRHKQMMAVFYADLDGFKGVNDVYGHDAGDATLQEIARRWKACVRETDTVARLGGDEFAVVFGEIGGLADVELLARKLIASASQPIELANGNTCTVGASIGISIYPADASDSGTLLRMADTAMYASKHRGKNAFTLAGAMTAPPAAN